MNGQSIELIAYNLGSLQSFNFYMQIHNYDDFSFIPVWVIHRMSHIPYDDITLSDRLIRDSYKSQIMMKVESKVELSNDISFQTLKTKGDELEIKSLSWGHEKINQLIAKPFSIFKFFKNSKLKRLPGQSPSDFCQTFLQWSRTCSLK